MKIVITGAAGFVAAHLIRCIQEAGGDEVYAWIRDQREAQQIALDQGHIAAVDITREERVFEAIRSIRPDRVYHLAAQSSVGRSWKLPAETMQVNTIGTIHLLEGLRQYVPHCRVLLIGSAEQYGRISTEELPVSESRRPQAGNPYSISKIAQEQIARLYVDHFQMQIVLVRAFNHIGPGQSPGFVIPDWCSQAAAMERGRQPHIIQVGNLQIKRDFTDVRDIVRAYRLLLEKGQSGQVYNVGSGRSYSLNQVLQIIFEESKLEDIRYEVDQEKLRPADIEELTADISRLRQTIDWEPQYSLRQSIHDIMEEMRGMPG